MAAVTRWVQYDVTAAGTAGTGGGTNYGRGTKGYSIATASVGDDFDIGTSNNRLYITIDSESGPYITLASGSNLDPRFVAKDITEKLHNLGKATTGYDQSQCIWENNRFILYSGSLGSASSAVIASGTNTAHLELGWGSKSESGGFASVNGDTDNYISVSGTYNGFFDETYHIIINSALTIGTPSKGGSNTYTGTITTGGMVRDNETITYVLSIDTSGGKTTMGAGTGNVPTVSWTGTGSSSGAAYDDGGPVELLYADHWYKIGVYGLMVKFTDAVFNTVATGWTIVCAAYQYAEGANLTSPYGTAKFIWGSSRGDDATSVSTTSTSSWVRLGTRGLYVKFTQPGGNATAGDEFRVVCTPPQPSSYSITNLNYGNVTVSTESPVKSIMFEILSGAVEISTVKFGLQSHGGFSHHVTGAGDTYFRFGTLGPGNNAGTAPMDGYEWWSNVAAADIDSDTNPTWLYATKENLAVVSDADSSEDIGVSTYGGMVADPIWLNIKLGQSEVGANSTINYRIYFDYS